MKTPEGFWSEWSDSNARPREPKSRALPTALHPDIQFFCMIPREEGKSKFPVSVGGAVVKPGFAGVFHPGNFRRKLLSQGLPGSRFQGNGWDVYPPKASALPTALHPDIQFSCMIPCGEGKSKFFVSVGGAVVTPNFAGVFQLIDFRRKLLSQGLPEFRFWGNG